MQVGWTVPTALPIPESSCLLWRMQQSHTGGDGCCHSANACQSHDRWQKIMETRTLSFYIWHPCMWWYSHIWWAVSAGFVELRGRSPWCIICDLINTEILDSSGNSCKEILVPFFPIWCRHSSSLRYMYAVAWGQGLYPL